jgi:uncharacterized heparinase superfamily protein
MYHAIVTEDVLDVINLTKDSMPEFADELRGVAARMLYWLMVVSHPDGRIALCNDSAIDGCATLAELLTYAAALNVTAPDPVQQGVTLLRESGYARLSSGSLVVIADVGSVGPDHLPGHAHADTLSFELSLSGQRFVVDSGTSTYENNPERHRQRGSRAHNTIVIDGRDSSEVWSAFRVGRRARTFGVRATAAPAHACIEASHDGYQQVADIVHTRRWRLMPDGLLIVDRLSGTGAHEVEWLLHVHPDVELQRQTTASFDLRHVDVDEFLRLSVDSKLPFQVEESTYHPQFGLALTNALLVGKATASMPIELVFRFEVCS